nr:Chain C, GP41 PEPTIDE ANALOG [Human immunodeficiency virus 1]
EQDKWAS